MQETYATGNPIPTPEPEYTPFEKQFTDAQKLLIREKQVVNAKIEADINKLQNLLKEAYQRYQQTDALFSQIVNDCLKQIGADMSKVFINAETLQVCHRPPQPETSNGN
jgi:hypothetical protein